MLVKSAAIIDLAKHYQILSNNLEKITKNKNLYFHTLNIDFQDNDYNILENEKVKLFITLSKNLRIKEVIEEIEVKETKKLTNKEEEKDKDWSKIPKKEKPDEDKKETKLTTNNKNRYERFKEENWTPINEDWYDVNINTTLLFDVSI